MQRTRNEARTAGLAANPGHQARVSPADRGVRVTWAKLRRLFELDPQAALAWVDETKRPWNQAIGYAWVARFMPDDPIPIAFAAAEAASRCDDRYQRSASRAWEIAALAERGLLKDARESLAAAVGVASSAEPAGSRAEAYSLLLAAAVRIDLPAARVVAARVADGVNDGSHWRAKRAVWSAAGILAAKDSWAAADFATGIPEGKLRDRCLKETSKPRPARPFFW